MSKQYNIRWKQSDNDELKKAVKNFNAKISRLEKKNPEMKYALPERVTMREMRELIDTRQDLKRELNALRRFSQRGAEELIEVPENKYNLQITKWQKNEMSRRAGVINRKRKDRLDTISDIEMKSRGENLGYTKGQIGMGKADEIALKPIKPFTPAMNRRDINKRFRGLKKESQTSYWEIKELRLKQNVIKGIQANYSGLFPDDVDEIIDAIEDMDFKEFYNRFMSESGEMEIVSPPPGSSMDEMMKINIESLKSTWVPNYQKE